MSQQINLFNPIFLKQKKVFSALAMARALGVLLAGALAVAFFARHNVDGLQREAARGPELQSRHEQRLASVRTQYAPRQKSAALEAEIDAAQARLQALRNVAGVLERGELGNTRGYSEYFKALARQNRSGVWLTRVSISGAGSDIGVQGKALEPALVPAYLGRLTNEQVMRGKAFGSLRISQPVTQAVIQAASAGDVAAGTAKSMAAPPYVEFSLESNPNLVEAAK